MVLHSSKKGDIEPTDQNIYESLVNIRDNQGSFLVLETDNGLVQAVEDSDNIYVVEIIDNEHHYQLYKTGISVKEIRDIFVNFKNGKKREVVKKYNWIDLLDLEEYKNVIVNEDYLDQHGFDKKNINKILFFLESEDYIGIHNFCVHKLESDPDNNLLWYFRAITCIALTNIETDKSKEFIASISRIKVIQGELNNLPIKLLNKVLISVGIYWKNEIESAKKNKQQSGKLDNLTLVDVAVQRQMGRYGVKDFVNFHSEKIDRLLEGCINLINKLNHPEGSLVAQSIFKELNWLVHYGFDSGKKYDGLHNKLLLIRESCLSIDYKNPNNYELGSALNQLWGNTKTNKTDGCFVATAVYGSYNHQIVYDFRVFRDVYLLKSVLGKVFVDMYYYIGPHFANFIKSKPILKVIVRKSLLNPIHKIIKFIH